MSTGKRTERIISVDRIFLHHENPRHEPYETQSQVIDYLCRHENVLPLARDISRHGLNPLERFALFRDANSERGTETNYVVAEGNRRVCAIKLLNDPDLAPPDKRKDFERLAEEWSNISQLPSIIFEDMDDLDLWLARTHQGPQGGIGRKDWNAVQKQRHSGGSKNKIALALLDYAVDKGFMSSEDRKGKLTTIQRYVGNPLIRDALGLDLSEPEDICRNRPAADFELLLKKLISDLTSDNPKVNSRSRKPQIDAYARELSALEGQTRQHIDPQPITANDTTPPRKGRQTKPGKYHRPQHVPYEAEIKNKIKSLGSMKLESLYYSICKIPLEDHTPLLAVGVWSFFETLTARAGRENTDFQSFLKGRLRQYGFEDRKKTNALREALQRISYYGNTTKHHDTAATFNGTQLANDIDTLKDVIIACAEEALSKK